MVYVDKQTGVILDRESFITCGNCGAKIDVSGLKPFTETVCPACQHTNPIPARLGHFLLYSLIGTGGMGGIYHCKDEALGRDVAIKVMLQSLGADEEIFKAFKREAQAAAQINHPNIVQIYSFGQEKGQPYIVMELVKGSKFVKMIEDSPKGMDPGTVLQIAIDIAQGLQAASEANLVHGDVKPENILLDEKMQAKLVDFGLASLAKQQAAGGIWGTPYYIAPEKVRGQPADFRSDIYSLGATMFHALTGRPPFEGDSPEKVVRARLGAKAPHVSQFKPKINRDLDRIVARMLQEEVSLRYPTYASLIGDMKRAMKDIAPSFSQQSISGSKGKKLILTKKTTKPMSAAGITTSATRTTNKVAVEPKTSTISTLNSEKHKPVIPRLPGDKKPKKGKGKGPLIALVIFILLALIGSSVAIGMFISAKKKAEIAARAEALALSKEKEKISDLYDQIAKLADKIAKIDEKTISMPEKATNSVFVILGELIRPSPPEPPPAPTNTLQQAQSDQKTSTNSPAASSNETAKIQTPVEQPPPPPPDDRPAIVLAKRVINGVWAVRERAKSAKESKEKALALRDESLASATISVCSTNAGILSDLAAALPQFLTEAETNMKDAETALRELTALEKNTVKRREEEARRQAEELRRMKEEQMRKEKIDSELKRVDDLQSQALEMLKKFRCREAFALIEKEQSSFNTAEGKAAFATLLERYKYMKGFKQYLIDSINTTPFRWGWGSGPSAKDIISADENGITVTGGKEFWENMRFVHLAHIARYYLKMPNAKSSLIAEQTLAMGIYQFLMGQYEEAVRLRDQAIETARYLEEDARRLVPSKRE